MSNITVVDFVRRRSTLRKTTTTQLVNLNKGTLSGMKEETLVERNETSAVFQKP
jgi:hypothetical protein